MSAVMKLHLTHMAHAVQHAADRSVVTVLRLALLMFVTYDGALIVHALAHKP
jgi:hypothetical protein